MDHDGNKFINYSEFLSAALDVNTHLTSERLNAIFRRFDTQNIGYISKKGVAAGFNKLGRRISEKEIEEIFEKGTFMSEGKISIEEFKGLVLSNEGS